MRIRYRIRAGIREWTTTVDKAATAIVTEHHVGGQIRLAAGAVGPDHRAHYWTEFPLPQHVVPVVREMAVDCADWCAFLYVRITLDDVFRNSHGLP